MEKILKIMPRPVKRPTDQGQWILPFLSMEPSMQPVSSTLVNALAGKLAIAPISIKALVIIYGGYGGEGRNDGK